MQVQCLRPIWSGCRSRTCFPSGWDAGLVPMSWWVGMQNQNLCSNGSGLVPVPHQVWLKVQHLCPIRLGCRTSTCVPSCQDTGLAPLPHQSGMQAQCPNPAGFPLGARLGALPKIQEVPMEPHQPPQCQVQPCTHSFLIPLKTCSPSTQHDPNGNLKIPKLSCARGSGSPSLQPQNPW